MVPVNVTGPEFKGVKVRRYFIMRPKHTGFSVLLGAVVKNCTGIGF